MKFFITIINLVLFFKIFSQNLVPEWSNFTNANGPAAQIILIDSSENVVVCSETYHPGSVIGLITTKFDSLGNFIWEKKFDSFGIDRLSSSVLDKQGNIYVAGTTQAQFAPIAEGLLFKYDSATGDTLWSYHYPYQNPPLNTGISKVYITPDQQILVLGTASGANTPQSFTFLVALDTAGQTTWQSEIYGGTGFGLVATSNGYTLWGSKGDQFICWQLDALGNVLDQNYTPAYPDPSGGPVFIDGAGNLYVGDNYGEHKVTKYNTQGLLDWTYAKPFVAHPNPNYVTARAEGINVDNEGNVFFGGMYYNGTPRRHYQTCLDSNGNLLWEHILIFDNKYGASGVRTANMYKNLYINTGSYLSDSLVNYYDPFVAVCDKNGIVYRELLDIVGNTNAPRDIQANKEKIYLAAINYDSLNNPRQFLSKYKADVIYSTTAESGFIPTVNVHPNPATHACTVVLSNPGGEQPATLEVIDVQGQILHHQSIRLLTGEQQIPVPHVATLPNGIYFIRVGTARSAFTRRLVKI